MNRTMIAALITTCVVATSTAPLSLAQGYEERDQQMDQREMGAMDRGGSKGMMGMGMGNVDRDGNGKVSRSEFLEAHEQMFDKMDQDGDDTLSQDEMHQGRGMMNQ